MEGILWAEVYDEKYRLNLRTGKNFDKVLEKIDPLVKKFASEYSGKFRYLTFEELCQEIRIIAIEGMHNYDKGKKTKFSTFLHHHINNKIISLLRSDRKMGNNASTVNQEGLNVEIPLYSALGKQKWSEDSDPIGMEGLLPESSAIFTSRNSNRYKRITFRQSVLSVLEKRSPVKYKIERDAITRILLYDHTIKEIAEDHNLSGWAISMRIKEFGKKYLKDLLINEDSAFEYMPPPRRMRSTFVGSNTIDVKKRIKASAKKAKKRKRKKYQKQEGVSLD